MLKCQNFLMDIKNKSNKMDINPTPDKLIWENWLF